MMGIGQRKSKKIFNQLIDEKERVFQSSILAASATILDVIM